ncbi:MAG: hypothetical protein QG670_2401 [Thermoproteota archaeon]|nr:hypothetical protein [Thermoproteota archaeon]
MESIKRLEIGDILSPKVQITPETPISKVVGILKDQNVYEAFLEYEGKIGMLTTRDILKVSNMTVEKASSLAFFVPQLTPKSTIGEAARLMMEYRIRALPVVEGKKFIGEILALSIINMLKGSNFSNIKAQSIMTGNPITLDSEDLTSKARSLMIRRKIDNLPVLDKGKLKGIVTSNNIVLNRIQATETINRDTMMSEEQRKLEFPVKYVMDSNPLTCGANDSIGVILDEMIKQGTGYSIVTLWEEVQGIITYRDYMKLLAEQLKASDVSIYVVGLPEDPFEAEMVKSKFTKTVELLKRSFPFIEEAKSVIRTSTEEGRERKRFEVNVSIVTPRRTFSYSEQGWELSQIFDALSNKLKKMMTQKRSRRTKEKEE